MCVLLNNVTIRGYVRCARGTKIADTDNGYQLLGNQLHVQPEDDDTLTRVVTCNARGFVSVFLESFLK